MGKLQKFIIAGASIVILGAVVATGLVIAVLGLVLLPVFMLLRKDSLSFPRPKPQTQPEIVEKSIDAAFERVENASPEKEGSKE